MINNINRLNADADAANVDLAFTFDNKMRVHSVAITNSDTSERVATVWPLLVDELDSITLYFDSPDIRKNITDGSDLHTIYVLKLILDIYETFRIQK